MPGIPRGWERLPGAGPLTKIVKREAVEVPKQYAGDEPFYRDAVVVFTDELAGVVKGPGARQSWQVADPEAVACRLAETIDEWCAEGGDPYGGADLNDRLDDAVAACIADATDDDDILEVA